MLSADTHFPKRVGTPAEPVRKTSEGLKTDSSGTRWEPAAPCARAGEETGGQRADTL